MSLEENILNEVEKYIQGGYIEEKIHDAMEVSINKAVSELFTRYDSPVTKAITEKLKSQMLPAIEKHDFSEYIVKLDDMLTDILKNSTLENKEILENFKSFASFNKPEKITTSELFEHWLDVVAKEIDTSELEIDFDDKPSYQSPICTLSVKKDYEKGWSTFEHAKVEFSCDEDESLDLILNISRWGNEPWKINGKGFEGLVSLRNLNDFQIYVANLNAYDVPIEIDETYITVDDLDIEAEPEANFS